MAVRPNAIADVSNELLLIASSSGLKHIENIIRQEGPWLGGRRVLAARAAHRRAPPSQSSHRASCSVVAAAADTVAADVSFVRLKEPRVHSHNLVGLLGCDSGVLHYCRFLCGLPRRVLLKAAFVYASHAEVFNKFIETGQWVASGCMWPRFRRMNNSHDSAVLHFHLRSFTFDGSSK